MIGSSARQIGEQPVGTDGEDELVLGQSLLL
ncbi:hypothetical protein SAMN05216404_102185 [Nitrosospira multiformis]|uniref:Uncharacterized protein n=1 Tax=Nitrosospira multiformis TaxID=1231 RepID=A0A1H8D705_9PROT|nr:hypothetical protein SAMN05216404_102185 [Nitrosospira multiformis]